MAPFVERRHYSRNLTLCPRIRAFLTVETLGEVNDTSMGGISVPTWEHEYRVWRHDRPEDVHKFRRVRDVHAWMRKQADAETVDANDCSDGEDSEGDAKLEDPTGDRLRIHYSFDDWQDELRKLHANERDAFFQRAFKRERPYVGAINFLSAVMDRFFDLGYLSTALAAESRKECRDRAEGIADMIRDVFSEDAEKIRLFEDAYRVKKEYCARFDSDAVKKTGIINVD